MATMLAQTTSVMRTNPGYLVMSPYSKQGQQLDLGAIPHADQLLAKALKELQPVREDYQTSSYVSAFNWPTIIERLRAWVQEAAFEWKEMRLYVIVFRSANPPGIDRQKLWALDEDAFTEAMVGGGLYRYWCGEPDQDGNNLSTCEWFLTSATVAVAEPYRHMALSTTRSGRYGRQSPPRSVQS